MMNPSSTYLLTVINELPKDLTTILMTVFTESNRLQFSSKETIFHFEH